MVSRRVPEILQEEVFECGLACLVAIAQAHNREVSLAGLRRQFDVTSSGLTLLHLIRVAAALGMTARGVRFAADQLEELSLPAVVTWNSRHFVVLNRVTGKHVDIMDPAVGYRRFAREEAAEFFSGTGLEITAVLHPDGSGDSLPPEIGYDASGEPPHPFAFDLRHFLATAFESLPFLLPLLAVSLCIQLAGVAGPKFISLTIDEVLAKNDRDLLELLIYIFGATYAVKALSGYLKNALKQYWRIQISVEQGSRIVMALMQMPLKYFLRRSAANVMRRVRAVDSIHIMYTQGYIEIAVAALFMFSFSVLMFLINMRMASLVTISGVAFFVLRIILLPRFKSLMFAAFDWEVRRDYQLFETLRSIGAVKLRNLSYLRASNWISEHARFESHRTRLDRIIADLEVVNASIVSFQNLAVVYLGAEGVMAGDITIGSLVAFLFYKDLFLENANMIVSAHVGVQLAQVETGRLKDIRPAAGGTEQPTYAESSKEQPVLQRLELADVSFGYTSLDDPVLQNVRFYIDCPEKVSISGPSGSGKSTLIHLMCGLLTPTAGAVLFNGISMQRLPGASGQQISLCSPRDEIIDGSVVDNILFGNPDLDVERLEQVLEDAGMRPVIRQLAHGLNTRLGTSGAGLSSGQMQRLMLARALYPSPRLLILDEPTAHLDPETAAAIVRSIGALSMAVVLVTHDPAVEAICSRRYRIDGGIIKERRDVPAAAEVRQEARS